MKKIYIILAFLALVIGIGMLFFNKNEGMRVPKPGLYFLQQNSFYAINPDDRMNISLDFYEVSRGDFNKNYIDKCSDFVLVSDKGEEYPISIDKEYIYDENRNVDISDSMAVYKYRANVSMDIDKNIKFVGIGFESEEKGMIYQDVGCIEFYICTDVERDISITSNRIDWESFVQPTFEHIELVVSNEEKTDVTIKNIYYGYTGIEILEDDISQVKQGENKTIEMNVNLSNEKKGEPIVYYLKPVIRSTYGNESIEIICDNVSREAYYGTVEEIREYLYKVSEK